MTDANTLATMVQQLMMGLGIVAGALLLNASALLRGRPTGLPDVTDFRNTLIAIVFVALVGLFDTFRLERDAGRSVSGHQPPSMTPADNQVA